MKMNTFVKDFIDQTEQFTNCYIQVCKKDIAHNNINDNKGNASMRALQLYIIRLRQKDYDRQLAYVRKMAYKYPTEKLINLLIDLARASKGLTDAYLEMQVFPKGRSRSIG